MVFRGRFYKLSSLLYALQLCELGYVIDLSVPQLSHFSMMTTSGPDLELWGRLSRCTWSTWNRAWHVLLDKCKVPITWWIPTILVLEILNHKCFISNTDWHPPFGFFGAESLGSRVSTALRSLAVQKAKSRLSCFCVHLLTPTVSKVNPRRQLEYGQKVLSLGTACWGPPVNPHASSSLLLCLDSWKKNQSVEGL